MAREISTYIKNNKLIVIIKPNAPANEFCGYDESRHAVRISIKAPAIDGKANIALTKFLKKETGRPCIVKSGITSRIKIIEFVD